MSDEQNESLTEETAQLAQQPLAETEPLPPEEDGAPTPDDPQATATAASPTEDEGPLEDAGLPEDEEPLEGAAPLEDEGSREDAMLVEDEESLEDAMPYEDEEPDENAEPDEDMDPHEDEEPDESLAEETAQSAQQPQGEMEPLPPEEDGAPTPDDPQATATAASPTEDEGPFEDAGLPEDEEPLEGAAPLEDEGSREDAVLVEDEEPLEDAMPHEDEEPDEDVVLNENEEPREEEGSHEEAAPHEDAAPNDGLLHRPTQDASQMTIPMPSVTAPMPQASEAPEPQQETPGTTPENPTLADVGTTFARWLHNWIGAVRERVTHHQMATIAIGLACVAVVATFVLLSMDARQTPPNNLITEDAFAQLQTPEHAASPFTPDEPLELRSIEVVDKQPSETRKDACDVEVVATFDNDHMETRAEGRLTYVRTDGDWSCTASSIDKVSHYAKTGVDTGLVIENIGELLQAADSDDGRESLASLYRNANLTVTEENFSEEKQTEDLVIHCMSNGTFVSYSCDLAAQFKFAPASGAWELSSASVSDGAKDLGFDPLIGTWRGTFVSQASTQAKCLAAQEAGLTVDITQANMTQDGGAVIEGTVSGIAHMHADLPKDVEAAEGDLALESAPFSGHLASQSEQDDPLTWLLEDADAPAGIVFECALQDVANGSIGLTLELGSATAPDAATATLTSTHLYEGTVLLIVPYTREAIFADTFSLQKEAPEETPAS